MRTRPCRRMRASRFVLRSHQLRSLGGLAGLLADVFALVADALALVRLGLADLADVRRDLADQLLVDAAHHDPRGRRDLELDARRARHDLTGCENPSASSSVVALQRRAVADARRSPAASRSPSSRPRPCSPAASRQAVSARWQPLVVRAHDAQRRRRRARGDAAVELARRACPAGLSPSPGAASTLELDAARDRRSAACRSGLIVPSPHVAEHFAADARFLPRVPVRHDALRRRKDRDAQAAHAPAADRRGPAVDAQPGLAHALQPGDRALPSARRTSVSILNAWWTPSPS